jgi:diguanylate cyclase (GGDEF)-like protein
LLREHTSWFALAGLLILISLFAVWLRALSLQTQPYVYGYGHTVGGVLALTIAASAFLRFRGAGDRLALMSAFGFAIVGFSEGAVGLRFAIELPPVEAFRGPGQVEWQFGRTFLGVLLLAALWMERKLPSARRTGREIAGALALVSGVAYVTAMVYFLGNFFGLSADSGRLATAWLPRPSHLLLAGVFAICARLMWKRLGRTDAPFDRALLLFAVLGAASHLLAAHGETRLDGAYLAAMMCKMAGYVALLGGVLLDNVRLFDQVRHLASSDALTGLANFRRFTEALEAELERSKRTARPFAVLLMDLDGLKKINDTHGHDVGSRAICRLADVLRRQCRHLDTAARFGGDEFALILPETGQWAARRVAQRIGESLSEDPEKPALSVSAGVAVFPRDGDTSEALQRVADQELYARKRMLRRKRKPGKAASAA